jgi:hypothetical protein
MKNSFELKVPMQTASMVRMSLSAPISGNQLVQFMGVRS